MSDDPASEVTFTGSAAANAAQAVADPDQLGLPNVATDALPPREGEEAEMAGERSGDGEAEEVKPTPPAPATPGSPDSSTTPSATAPRFRPSYVFLVVVTLVNLVADLWSKHWAKTAFESAHPATARKLVVIEDYLNLIYAKNRGGAWGLLQNETEALRRPFFLIVSVAAIVFIVSLYRKLAPDQKALMWGLPLVLGGALGNLIDRIRYGFVVDFIDVYSTFDGQAKHWPTFNVADISICIGVGLMAIDMFTPRSKKSTPEALQSAGAAAASPSAGQEQKPPGEASATPATALAPEALAPEALPTEALAPEQLPTEDKSADEAGDLSTAPTPPVEGI
jgi:signal peptidase II